MDEVAFTAALETLRRDRVQGASELARQALGILRQSATGMMVADGPGLCRGLLMRATLLREAHPSMAPIARLLGRWSEALEIVAAADLETIRRTAGDQAAALTELSRTAAERAAVHAARHIGSGKTLITHSLSSTVVAVFRILAGQRVRAILTESRPLNEGYRLAAILSELGVPTRLITDAQMGLAMADADAALVGADSLLPDGSLVNKAGTYLLALAARDGGVHLYVCCESFKLRTERMPPLELERMDPAELGAPPLAGVQIDNGYFDITPARLISAWFDETGMRPSLA